jgi:hypothetical protein
MNRTVQVAQAVLNQIDKHLALVRQLGRCRGTDDLAAVPDRG